MVMKKMSFLVALAMLGTVGLTSAGIIIEIEDGDSNAFNNWTLDPRYTGDGEEGVQSLATVDGETAVKVTGDTAGDFSPGEDVIFTTGPNLAGNLNFSQSGLGIEAITFDFYAGALGEGSGGAPDALTVYFQGDGGSIWFYNIDTADIGDGWNSYKAGLLSADGWEGYASHAVGAAALGSGDFLGDLVDVDRIGISIQYGADLDGQVYGIDDYALTIPEPETYLVLGMALLSIAVVFRKRISDSLADARAMMQA